MAGPDHLEHGGNEPADQPGAEPPARVDPPAPVHRTRRLVLRTLGPVLAVLLIVLGWGGWQLWQLASNLLALRDVAVQAQGHVKARDLTALTGDIARGRDLAAAAGAAADAPAVGFASGLPWVGDDVRVARELAGVAAGFSAGTMGVDPLLARLADTAGPDLLASAGTRDVITQVRTAADAAATRLARLDLNGLTLPVGDEVTRLKTALGTVGPAVDALSPYLKALEILASHGTHHTWFVVMQNLGEARPSGGMIGSWLIVRTSNGKLEVLKKGFNGAFPDGSVDYKGYLPEAYEQVFGNSMSDWRSLNLSAHFPDNARLFAHAWNARGQEKVDGVLALGQGTVRFLAAATGPVEVNGRTIAPSDLADYLSIGIYKDFPNAEAKDDAVAEIITKILGTLSSGKLDLAGLVASAMGEPSADYLQLWSSDPAVQHQVEAAGVSGSFTDEPGPVASVRLADAAANKLDSFVHLAAEYRLGACVVDDDEVATRNSTFTVSLRNKVPSGLPDYVTGKGDLFDGLHHAVGSSRDFVVVYTPVQATITSALLNGKPAVVQSAWVRDRQMLVFDVKLDPGARADIAITWEEFPTDGDDRAFSLTPRIVLPPLANPAEINVVDGSQCR